MVPLLSSKTVGEQIAEITGTSTFLLASARTTTITAIFGRLVNLVLINNLIIKHSKLSSVPSELLRAVCQTESGMNPYVVRHEPTWNYFQGYEDKAKLICNTVSKERALATMKVLYSTSFGLCQIMGAVYYDMGGKEFATELIDPEVNLIYATKILKKIMEKYDLPHEIYAVYNAGALRYKKNGELINQENVNRFKTIFSHK